MSRDRVRRHVSNLTAKTMLTEDEMALVHRAQSMSVAHVMSCAAGEIAKGRRDWAQIGRMVGTSGQFVANLAKRRPKAMRKPKVFGSVFLSMTVL